MKICFKTGSGRQSPPMPRCAEPVVCALLLLASSAALAAGPVGPVGPIGPVGVEPAVPRPGRPAVPRPSAPPKPSASAGAKAAPTTGNHIEVSGNTASGTRCADGGAASVNSVDVSGARLDGRTVIVQGRNANNVRTTDCPERATQPAQNEGASGQTPQTQQPSQINSIRIR